MITTATSSALRPLGELIEPRPQRPETVLTLQTAITDRLGTVRSFEFPPSIKRHVEQVLDAVAEGRGRAFWVQSEYGGGKTHFIAALTALLGQSPAGGPADAAVWAEVKDAQVRSRAHEFSQRRLLAVAISCKGIMPVNGQQLAQALLNLLMDGFSAALETYGLAEQIPVRGEQELFALFRQRPLDIRGSIDVWVRAHFGASVEELYDNDPTTAARAISEWYRMAGATPEIDEKVVDWLARFCRRLKGAGFDGLLVVIDGAKALAGGGRFGLGSRVPEGRGEQLVVSHRTGPATSS